MELWIKSQNKECLMKVDRLDYDLSNSKHRIMANGYQTLVAEYETKERALEVLDEIQNKLKEKYIVKAEGILLRPEDEDKIEYSFNKKYGIDAIVVPRHLEITPVNKDIIVYEMPEE